jgi:hypothetical protein
MQQVIAGLSYDVMLRNKQPVIVDLTTGIGVPKTINANTVWTSAPIVTKSFPYIAVSITSTQAGGISLQTCLDQAGLIPTGQLVTTGLAAATPGYLAISPGLIFQSIIFNITNAGGSVATISNVVVLLSDSNIGTTYGAYVAGAASVTPAATLRATSLVAAGGIALVKAVAA